MANEIARWRSIDGWPGYEVSTAGAIKSIPRTIIRSDGRPQRWKGHILRGGLRKGYLIVVLSDMSNGKKPTTVAIHQVVCRTFHGPRPTARHEVAHGDGNRTNNCADNLRWATRQENSIDAVLHGRRINATITMEQARQIRGQVDSAIKHIAKQFGVSRDIVERIGLRQTWGWDHSLATALVACAASTSSFR